MQEDLEPLLVSSQETSDLAALLDDYRLGRMRPRPVPVVEDRRQPKIKYVKVVMATGHDGSGRYSALEMRDAAPSSQVFDVVLFGGFDNSDSASWSFGLLVGPSSSQRTVEIPASATAEEFHTLCGFPETVLVTLGGLETVGETEFPVYRWRVEFTDHDDNTATADWRTHALQPAVADWLVGENVLLRQVFMVGTDQGIQFHDPLLTFGYREPRRWNTLVGEVPIEVGDGWHIDNSIERQDGDMLMCHVDADEWVQRTASTNTVERPHKIIPQVDSDGNWVLHRWDETEGQLIPVEALEEDDVLAVVWYRDGWHLIEDVHQWDTDRQGYIEFLGGVHFTGYDASLTPFEAGSTWSQYEAANSYFETIQAGTMCIIGWTGFSWVLLRHELRPWYGSIAVSSTY